MNIRTMAVFLAIVGALVCGTVAYAETPLTDNEKQGNAPKGMYSAEKLDQRIQRIISAYQVDVVYDNALTSRVEVPAVEKKSVEHDLSESLKNTQFSYKKNAEKGFYTVYQDNNKSKGRSGRGTISGTVLDSNGFPIPGATLFVEGMKEKGTATDIKGQFTLKDIPARDVKVEISCISYRKMLISDVKVYGGKTTPLDVILQDETEMLNEVVVTATYNRASANGLYAKQKAMVAMSDGVSSDLIKRTADNNVAQVLKRVSGVTIDNGKYVTVRGMSERYNNVQLNGSTLPSTEPNRRNFSFDIIPTALIDNVTIAKTFTPDMPGEFTGGLVQVNTLSVPEKPLVSVSIGTGFNSISTGKEFKSNTRFKSDYLFGNSRDWYGNDWNPDRFFEIMNNNNTQYADYNFLTDEGKKLIHNLNARIPNHWGLGKKKASPTQNYAITVGMPFDLGNDNRLGIIASLTYRHEENTDDLLAAIDYSGSDTLYTGKQYRFVTSTGAVANISWERPGHKVTWRNLFNNRFTHNNLERIRYDADSYNCYQLEQYSKPLINRLWQTQLEGEHRLPLDMVFTWMGDFSKMNRTAPDDRYTVGLIKSEVPSPNDNYLVDWLIPRSAQSINDGHIYYSGLEEKKTNIGTNLEYPFIVEGNKQKMKVGYLGSFRRADFKQLYLTMLDSDDIVIEEGLAVDDRFSPDRFANGELRYGIGGLNGNKDYYNGKQDIHAAYIMGEFSFFKKLHLTAGVRMEKTDMSVFTSTEKKKEGEFTVPVDSTITRKYTDWLPAATAVYNITDNLNVRAAYSKTMARPDFRELSVGTYYNVDDRIFVRSLGALRQSYTHNVDLRFEWYPQAGEVVSISGFYKRFNDPVEMISNLRPGGGAYEMFSVNLEKASIMGVEFNLRKSFDFLAPGSILKDIYLTANASIIKGNVEYNPEDEINKLAFGDDYVPADNSFDRKRPLQGLAPYLVNVGLMYQGDVLGANINYSRNGRKLFMAGTYEKLDEFENSRDVLDLQVSARFLKEKLEVKFNASDLLNQPFIRYRNTNRKFEDLTDDMNYNEGDWVLNKYKRGTSYSFSVSYRF